MQKHVLRLVFVALAAVGSVGFAAAPAGAAEEATGTTCSSDTGVATLSPGIGETAKVQNITVKGTLGECTGATGSSAKYVVHLKTTSAVTCASFNSEGATAEGTAILKWGHGNGNSHGTLTVTGSPETGFSLSGTVTEGPFAGLSMSSTLSGSPVFKGKGEPCSKKNRLKRIEVAGTSPFTIA
jgi:hypothetical protein